MKPEESSSTPRDDRERAGKSSEGVHPLAQENKQDEPVEFSARSTGMIGWVVLLLAVFGLSRYYVYAFHDSGVGRPMFGFFCGLLLAQLTLLGIHIGAGVRPWWKRVLMATVGVIWLVALFVDADVTFHVRGWKSVAWLLLAVLLLVVVPLIFIAKCSAWYFSTKRFVRLVSKNEVSLEPIIPQFAIRHMLIVTAMVAVLITLGRIAKYNYVDSRYIDGFDLIVNWILLSLLSCVGYGALAMVSLWACPEKAPLGPRLALVAIVTAVVVILALVVIPFHLEGAWLISRALVASTAVVIGFLLLMRHRGYRLMRR